MGLRVLAGLGAEEVCEYLVGWSHAAGKVPISRCMDQLSILIEDRRLRPSILLRATLILGPMDTDSTSTPPRKALLSNLPLDHLPPPLLLSLLLLKEIQTLLLIFFLLIDNILPKLDLQPMPMILIQVDLIQRLRTGAEDI